MPNINNDKPLKKMPQHLIGSLNHGDTESILLFESRAIDLQLISKQKTSLRKHDHHPDNDTK